MRDMRFRCLWGFRPPAMVQLLNTVTNVITASGLAPVPFTAAVLRAAGVYPDDVVDAWIQLHEQRTEAAFVEHMNKVQAWACSN